MIVAVNEAELARLDRREAEYDRIDVTDRITPRPDPPGRVLTYRGKPAHTQPPPDAVSAGEYRQIVTDGCAHRGEGFAKQFHATTLPHDWPIRHGSCNDPNRRR